MVQPNRFRFNHQSRISLCLFQLKVFGPGIFSPCASIGGTQLSPANFPYALVSSSRSLFSVFIFLFLSSFVSAEGDREREREEEEERKMESNGV